MLSRDYILSQCAVSAVFPCRLLNDPANAGGSTWSAGSNPQLSPRLVAGSARLRRMRGELQVSGSNPDRAVQTAR
jgi:hypothetical protein